MRDLSVYLHWPYCRSKCPYCGFMSVPEYNADAYAELEHLLLLDLKNSLQELDYVCIKTIFFGGGTPSLMRARSIENIIEFLAKNYTIDEQVEISLESNPATFNLEYLKQIKTAGINRLSLGVQSFKDRNLKFLGRIYNSEQASKAAELVMNVFDNYSFDLIYGYQTQSLADFQEDIMMAVYYRCPHISCYQLTFEENTPFFDKLRNHEINPINENAELLLFKEVQDFLEARSYERYEVSNYARPGFESKHNLAYWKYKNYLGIGPSAHSRLVLNDQKYELKKVADIKNWGELVANNELAYEERNALGKIAQLEEYFIMGLRLTEGISITDLYKMFDSVLLDPVLARLQQLVQRGLVKKDENSIILTERGFLLQDSIIEFVFS